MIEVDEEKKYPQLSLKDKFKFSCHKGIDCFGQCCRNVNIFLTPYDVLRMRKALGISSEKFLKDYTITLLAEPKLSMVLLKMKDNEHKSCPFVTSKGCSIYHDRPWACRMFPVGTADQDPNSADSEKFCFMVEKGSPCLGPQENREWTVAEWLQDQGIDQYDQKNEPFKAITQQRLLFEGKGLTEPQAQMYYVALYNLDRFRRLIFRSSFFERFNIEEKVKKNIEVDDEALLDFGFAWLRFSLFGEDTIKIRENLMVGKNQTESILDSNR